MGPCKFSVHINKEGYFIIAVCAVATFLLTAFSITMGLIGLAVTSFCCYFFRDPDRVIPKDKNLILSPADGKIVDICKSSPPEHLNLSNKTPRFVISIFLGLLDVHINRIATKGTIKALYYKPGKFLSACNASASTENEQQFIVMETPDKRDLIIKQVAGTVARRIVCNLHEGQEVNSGDRFGMIRFGSRVEIFLPEGVEPKVSKGQTVLAGETVMADLEGVNKSDAEISPSQAQ